MSDLKVIILPNSQSIVAQISQDATSTDHEWKLILLPQPRLRQPVKYLLQKSTGMLYEIKQVNGSNAHLKASQKLETDNGDAIKSMLIEENDHKTDSPNIGTVVQDPTVLVATKFNLAYIIISFFSTQDRQRATRYVSLEDVIDTMEQMPHFEHIAHVPSETMQSALAQVCDYIVENDEKYFKCSNDKTINFLKQKITALADQFPESIFQKLVLPSLSPADIDGKIPEDVLYAAKVKYSASLISSYLPNEVAETLFRSYSTEIKTVEEYIKAQKDIKDKKVFAEQSLASLNRQFQDTANTLGKMTARKSSLRKPPAKKSTKKTVKSQGGKGVLDYFKKA